MKRWQPLCEINQRKEISEMDPRTERMIRADIGLRRSPLGLALLIFVGSVVGLGPGPFSSEHRALGHRTNSSL